MAVKAALAGVGLAFVPEQPVLSQIESGDLSRVLSDWCPCQVEQGACDAFDIIAMSLNGLHQILWPMRARPKVILNGSRNIVPHSGHFRFVL
jgi:hypothetical protein